MLKRGMFVLVRFGDHGSQVAEVLSSSEREWIGRKWNHASATWGAERTYPMRIIVGTPKDSDPRLARAKESAKR